MTTSSLLGSGASEPAGESARQSPTVVHCVDDNVVKQREADYSQWVGNPGAKQIARNRKATSWDCAKRAKETAPSNPGPGSAAVPILRTRFVRTGDFESPAG